MLLALAPRISGMILDSWEGHCLHCLVSVFQRRSEPFRIIAPHVPCNHTVSNVPWAPGARRAGGRGAGPQSRPSNEGRRRATRNPARTRSLKLRRQEPEATESQRPPRSLKLTLPQAQTRTRGAHGDDAGRGGTPAAAGRGGARRRSRGGQRIGDDRQGVCVCVGGVPASLALWLSGPLTPCLSLS